MDAVRKAMLLGLGALNLTREKAEELIDDLVKRGEMSGNERAAMVEELLKGVERQKNELEGKVAVSVKKVMKDMRLPEKEDFQSIVKRLDRIESALGAKKSGKRGGKS
jgi:polyhydroxyalkanoate synthesis regulator phasin